MIQVNMLEAKTNLTKLIKLLETKQEDEIIIARDGMPVAKLELFEKPIISKRTGLFNGEYKPISLEEFNAMDKEIWGDLY